MTKILTLVVTACLLVVIGCQLLQERRAAPAILKQMNVNGASLKYLEQGPGTPVVFVHGSNSDHRIWEPEREVIAQRYRFIALSQRYFGTDPWPDDGTEFSVALTPMISPRSSASSRQVQLTLWAGRTADLSFSPWRYGIRS